MKLNFTLNCAVDIPNAERAASVTSVVTSSGEDITRSFTRFCEEHGLPLTSEAEIESAAHEYARKKF
jgi:hypothetical protein